MTFGVLLLTLIVLGVLAWLISIAPVINSTFKTLITYALIVIGALVLIDWLLIATGHSPIFNLPVR